MNTLKRKNIDLLVEKFWKQGYLTVSRRFGTYLPEPSKVGNFEVDIIARQKKNNYAIGITLTEEDLNNSDITEKLIFLATRQTKYTNKRVLLFVGVPLDYFKNAKALIDLIDPDIRKNIRLFQIVERPIPARRNRRTKQKVLFS